MSVVDIALLLVLLASVFIGLWRGLVYEVLSVAGWVTAFFVAQAYAAQASVWLPLDAASEPLRYAAGFAAVFVAVAFAAGMVSWVVKKAVDTVGLRPVDRTLGAAFGLVRGGIILLAAAWVISLTPVKDEPLWRASAGAAWLAVGLSSLKGTMPQGVAEYFP